jgi:hypothetical protein
MTNCPNCGSALGCSCQLRAASNGHTCCTNCIVEYENKYNPFVQTDQHIHINLNAEPPTQSS